jgi:hypothetical protein
MAATGINDQFTQSDIVLWCWSLVESGNGEGGWMIGLLVCEGISNSWNKGQIDIGTLCDSL